MRLSFYRLTKWPEPLFKYDRYDDAINSPEFGHTTGHASGLDFPAAPLDPVSVSDSKLIALRVVVTRYLTKYRFRCVQARDLISLRILKRSALLHAPAFCAAFTRHLAINNLAKSGTGAIARASATIRSSPKFFLDLLPQKSHATLDLAPGAAPRAPCAAH